MFINGHYNPHHQNGWKSTSSKWPFNFEHLVTIWTKSSSRLLMVMGVSPLVHQTRCKFVGETMGMGFFESLSPRRVCHVIRELNHQEGWSWKSLKLHQCKWHERAWSSINASEVLIFFSCFWKSGCDFHVLKCCLNKFQLLIVLFVFLRCCFNKFKLLVVFWNPCCPSWLLTFGCVFCVLVVLF
jgi:hypothetical protein